MGLCGSKTAFKDVTVTDEAPVEQKPPEKTAEQLAETGFLRTGCKIAQSRYRDSPGPFLLGDTFSLAETACAPRPARILRSRLEAGAADGASKSWLASR